MNIPQYDLDGLGGEYKVTKELEELISDFLGVNYAIMVNSGTAALFLALKSTGVRKVAVPNLTMFATAAAAELAGCELFFVSNHDIPEDVDAYIHVSLNGRDCGIKEVISGHPDTVVIEDACQSFCSHHAGEYLGGFGHVGCFSFSPHKIISAGNGGCVVTDDEEIALSARRLKNFGREKGGSDNHDFIGYNFKFTDLQATFMLPQFKEIKERIQKKKDIYKKYYDRLGRFMRPHKGTPWFVDIYVEDRDNLSSFLSERGVGTRLMYPLLASQKPFKKYKVHGDTTRDEYYSTHGLWLPSSLNITNEQIEIVTTAIGEWIDKRNPTPHSEFLSS